MYKKDYPYMLPIATDYKGRGEFPTQVTRTIAESPYYQSCSQAFDKKQAIAIPYAKAYDAAIAAAPSFAKDIAAPVPNAVAEAPQKAETKPVGVKKYFKKRILPLLLILIFALVGIAIPIVSSFVLVEDYIDIDVDILDIVTVFDAGFSVDVLTDNIPLFALALFLLLSLILAFKALVAILGKKKRGFSILALLTFAVSIVFVLACYQFDFQAIIEDIAAFDYGVYGLMACPLLAFVFSLFAYKKK